MAGFGTHGYSLALRHVAQLLGKEAANASGINKDRQGFCVMKEAAETT
jgi:hypothetical protein